MTEEQIAEAIEILTFYADMNNWGYEDYDGSENYVYVEDEVEKDKGYRAREFLIRIGVLDD